MHVELWYRDATVPAGSLGFPVLSTENATEVNIWTMGKYLVLLDLWYLIYSMVGGGAKWEGRITVTCCERTRKCLNTYWDVWKMSIPTGPTSVVPTEELFSPSPELLSTIALSVLLFVFLITNTVLCCLYRRRHGWSHHFHHTLNVSTSIFKMEKFIW